MLIPIGTDLPLKRHPTVTYILIVLNLLVFAIQWAVNRNGGIDSANVQIQYIAQFLTSCELSSSQFHILTLITYQFLHASWWHIVGNMIFLLPFGKAVEDRLGHVGFASLYLGCGVIGGAMHAFMSGGTVIGASGSVCAITAAFVVLAPASRIKVLLIFFIIGIYHIPSMLFVLFFVLFDSFSLLASLFGAQTSNTAWLVHLGGYIGGFSITLALIATGLLANNEFDLWYLLRQSKRRRTYRKIVSEVTDHTFDSSEKVDPLSLLVGSITQIAVTGDPLKAADLYLEALQNEPEFRLDQKTQLLIGSTLIKAGRIDDGVRVYENYLKHHDKADDRADVALLLAAKYTRDLRNEDRAKELLNDYESFFSKSHQSLVAALMQELQ
jgi:membrane associated rhomboid family serine protease